jgi:hypothetical protein
MSGAVMGVRRVWSVVGVAAALAAGLLAVSTAAASSASAVTAAGGMPSSAGAFIPVKAARVLDTRSGLGAPRGPVRGGSTVHLQVAGHGGVPGTGVSAVMLNVTVTQPTGGGVVTAYADGTSLPGTSNLNFVRGQTVPNLALVTVGGNGKLALHVAMAGTVQLVVDVQGYYLAGAATERGALTPLTPSRLLDSRYGVGVTRGPVSGRATVRLRVSGRGGVPAGVSAVVLNRPRFSRRRQGWSQPGPTARSNRSRRT